MLEIIFYTALGILLAVVIFGVCFYYWIESVIEENEDYKSEWWNEDLPNSNINFKEGNIKLKEDDYESDWWDDDWGDK